MSSRDTEEETMWTYSPTISVAIGTITMVLVFSGQIWFDKKRREGKDYDCAIVLTGRRMVHATFAFMGLFLIDAVLRMCLSNIVSFGNFARYALAAVLLCSVLGALLVIGTIFTAPTWKTLVVFFAMLGATLSLTIASFTGETQIEFQHVFYAGAAGVALTLVLDVVDFFHALAKKIKRDGNTTDNDQKGRQREILALFKNPAAIMSQPLWDASKRLGKLMNTRVFLVVFALFCAELIMLFEGMSLLVWV